MLELLFKDQNICVINKPSGYVVHKTRGMGDSPVILQELRDQIGETVFPVHRLDRPTSGCLIFSLSEKVTSRLQEELQSGSSIKKYMALCKKGLPSEGTFDGELTSEKGVKQTAITHFRVVQEFERMSLVELEILTGRKHQIRRHLSRSGHHILGDVQHGKGWLNRAYREKYGFHRLFLHCHFLSLIHPVTGERLNISCPLSRELEELLEALEKGES